MEMSIPRLKGQVKLDRYRWPTGKSFQAEKNGMSKKRKNKSLSVLEKYEQLV